MNERIRNLLLDSLERTLTPDEQAELDAALESSAELREERDQLLALQTTLADSTPQSFEPFFAARVMNRIEAEVHPESQLEVLFESMLSLFRKVAAVGAVAVIALVAYNLSTSDEISVASAFGVENETIEDVLESPFVASLE